MFSVALIGVDGAGKTTICRELEHALPLSVKYIYMGSNPDSSNYMLPTTRLIHAIKSMCGRPRIVGPPDPKRVKPLPKGALKRLATELKSSLGLVNWLSEEWFRQGLAWYYQRRGYIVLFDRHFLSDYYAYDMADDSMGRSLADRIHSFILDRLYPKPDLVIYLDAPAEVLFARKGEGTLEVLEWLRHKHRQIGDMVEHFAVVDANQSVRGVTRDVADLIRDFYEGKIGDRSKKALQGGRNENRLFK